MQNEIGQGGNDVTLLQMKVNASSTVGSLGMFRNHSNLRGI